MRALTEFAAEHPGLFVIALMSILGTVVQVVTILAQRGCP